MKIVFNNGNNGDCGLGIGDWGLGDRGLGPIPNPQSPIPNPQSAYICIINFISQKLMILINTKIK
jgi:hypothetical protein